LKIRDMSDELFHREMEILLSQVRFWAMRLDCIQSGFKLQPTPVTVGSDKFPFPFAAELKQCWDYARGTGPQPEEMEEIILELCELLWAPVAATSYDIPAAWWDTPLGIMVRMCRVRAKIEMGVSVHAEELSVLADVTGQRIRQMCAEGKLKAEKVAREMNSQLEWAIPAEEARKLLESK